MEESSTFTPFHIGIRIETLLSAKQITKAELSRRLGKANQNVGRALTRASMTTDFLQEIMNVTGIQSWEIFEQARPENKNLYDEMLEDKRTIIALQEELGEYKTKTSS